ncbi:serine hydrolase [Rhodococcus pseudokoreensis]|uniref:Serine hydrolase n=1 Tax=Rhodococcus pseudokoreensis TaxID=2811421 RepID=A0A974VYY6_9NOCA|nr:serine hydrolase [Rhodococcus pseudokoreensis]QSE88139.1 serine hydrolase [Rhodococcus pseudokoreensis]
MTNQIETLAAMGLFTGAPQHENFCRLSSLLPSSTLAPSSTPHEWPQGAPIELPMSYEYAGATRSLEQFFVDTDTAALLVLENGAVRYERYALTGGPDVPWISMSVAKSFISTLIGIAIADGNIGSIDEPISDYVPVNPGSAYDGVSIKNVLQMSSGAGWNEDYSDTTSDIFQLNAAMAGVGTLDDFVAGMVRENRPGTVCRYNSGDTQALGALLARATNRSITDYMQEKLYEPLGMTSPGYWLVDAAGREVAFAGLNMTARDFAKLGELYRNGGVWHGNQIVPEPWVRASITPDAPHLRPGQPIVGTHHFELGYGYQWWLPDSDRGEFSAIGVYNQFVYVDPTRSRVIVKLSANRAYGTTDDESTNRESETVAFLRTVAAAVA